MSVMQKAGFFAELGKANFAENIDAALARAEELTR